MIHWQSLYNAVVKKKKNPIHERMCVHILIVIYLKMLKDWNDLIPVDLLQPFVNTCSMKFMMTRQYPQAVSFLIFHEAYITSKRLPKAEDDVR